ncbi:autocrine proliferation repressor protein A-like [Ciona intestinalis]
MRGTVFTILVFVTFLGISSSTPLDDYVHHDDGYFNIKVVTNWTRKDAAHTSYLLNMTSQKWLTEKNVSRSVWWHYLIVNIPHYFDPEMHGSGYMKIVGGNNNNPDAVPDETDDDIMLSGMMAESTGSVTAILKQVPNQYIVFASDPKQAKRDEDAIIAFTWRHFIDDPSQPEWLLRMPMTKAAVKAMDAINAFVLDVAKRPVDKFCVGGESKRGWTTWTTAAVDYKRVKCITPIVMDELNLVKNLHHHYRAYGGWTFEFNDYYEEFVTRDLDNPNTQLMADIVDPLSYKDRLTMPKLIISTGSDEFFLPDDSYYYLDQLTGPTYLSMLPNTDHSCDGKEVDILHNVESFYVSSMKGYPLPQVTWKLTSNSTYGSIQVTSPTKPSLVRAFYAVTESSTRRDFRRYKLNETDPMSGPVLQKILWVFDGVTKHSDTEFSAAYSAPAKGWLAFFIELSYPVPGGSVMVVTTETNMVPHDLPFPDCSGEECMGTLV